jgi:hypothetical protein
VNLILILHIFPRVMMIKVHDPESTAQMFKQLPILHLMRSGGGCLGPCLQSEIRLD